jgi:hypothetical protein
MPDTYLDEGLAQARTDLLDAIHQPPLEQIAGRATTLRRRRRTVRSATALAAVAAIVVTLLRPWAGGTEADIQPADTRPSGPVYADAGITINGLTTNVPNVPDLPGTIADVEFADSDHGYLITDEDAFASTGDGGLTWQRHELPAGRDRPHDLILFPGGQLALPDGHVSADGGQTWGLRFHEERPQLAAGKDEVLRLGPANSLEVWSPQDGRRGVLMHPPPILVTWVASRPTADGAWWVSGSTPGSTAPVLASSRDGGATWKQVELTAAPPGKVQVSVLGRHAYATVVSTDLRIRAILHSADGGLTFTGTRTGGAAEPATLAGEVVPLLDGRLLVTNTAQRWYLSDDDGATFSQAIGNLPAVGALRRTWAGYVAYDLFGAGWAAFSSDGSTWRKLHIR